MAKLEMFRSDYREFTATVTDTYSALAEVHFAVKPKSSIDTVDLTDANAIFTVDATSANAVDNGNGTVTYTIIVDKTKTEGKTPGKYKGEVEYIDASGRSTTYSQFDFILNGDINQRP